MEEEDVSVFPLNSDVCATYSHIFDAEYLIYTFENSILEFSSDSSCDNTPNPLPSQISRFDVISIFKCAL